MAITTTTESYERSGTKFGARGTLNLERRVTVLGVKDGSVRPL